MMETFLLYMIRSSALTAGLYLLTKLTMEREREHGYVRLLWIAVMAVSAFLPLADFTFPVADDGLLTDIRRNILPEILIEADVPFPDVNTVPKTIGTPDKNMVVTAETAILCLYSAGVLVFALMFGISFVKTGRYISGCRVPDGRENAIIDKCLDRRSVKARILVSENDIIPFSFFRTIVLSRKDLYSPDVREILIHESAHVRLKHSWDMLATVIFTVVFWFNPCSWLIRRSLAMVHEYSADRTVLENGTDLYGYQLLLIRKAVGHRFQSVANSLNHSNLKNRITMMGNQKKNRAAIKSLLSIPVAALIVAVFSSAETAPLDKTTKNQDNLQAVEENMHETLSGPEQYPDKKVYKMQALETPPKFMGVPSNSDCNSEWSKWCLSQLKFPEKVLTALHELVASQETSTKVSITIYTQFVIGTDGKLSEMEVLKSKMTVGGGKNTGIPEDIRGYLTDEINKILSLSPAWEPGMINGKPVNVSYLMPFVFQCSTGDLK